MNPKVNMRVVIDTNVLLVSPFIHAPTYPIFEALMSDHLKICVTNEIIFEYEEIFLRKLGIDFAYKYIALLFKLKNTRYINPYFRWNLISADPDDNKFVDCAIAAGADFIITEDKHFEELKSIEFPTVHCIGALEFINQHLSK